MPEFVRPEQTTKTESTATEKAGKPKKVDAREMARERGKVKKAKPPKEAKAEKKADRTELCIFAFRLTKEQRDIIHAAAGPAKASQFVLAAALTAAAKK